MKKTSICLQYNRTGADECELSGIGLCLSNKVTVPSRTRFCGNVTGIQSQSFLNNKFLKSIVIPKGVKTIGYEAFKNCTNLRSVVLPEGLEKIGYGAFEGCSSLMSISLPSSLTCINQNTFKDCHSLHSIDLSKVSFIRESAFRNCGFLTDVKLGESLEYIDRTSFQKSGLYDPKNWHFGLLYLGNWVIDYNDKLDKYRAKKQTAGFAADIFADDVHIKRTPNPLYEELQMQFDCAIACLNGPIPDLSSVDQYFEDFIPVDITFEGTQDDWKSVIRVEGHKKIPANISTTDGIIHSVF